MRSLGHLMHGSSHSASTGSVTIGTPRLYEAFTGVALLGRRRAIYKRLAAASGARPGDRVVDVGCGPGFFTRILGAVVQDAGSVIGVDAAPEMIEYAASHSRNKPNRSFKVGTAESLPVDSGTVDVVVSTLVLHHLPAEVQVAALREMRRVLRPGGAALIADLDVTGAGFWTRLHLRLAGLSGMRRHAPSLEPMLASAGFTDIQTGRTGGWLGFARGINP